MEYLNTLPLHDPGRAISFKAKLSSIDLPGDSSIGTAWKHKRVKIRHSPMCARLEMSRWAELYENARRKFPSRGSLEHLAVPVSHHQAISVFAP